MIGYNKDLLTEILVHLPTKSLLRFKVVSMSIISCNKFCLAHTLSFVHHPQMPPTSTHCNLAMACFFVFPMANRRYFICNPTTRKLKMLSIPRHPVEDFLFLCINLAFDPLESPHHKIIYVRKQRKQVVSRESVCFIDIYSSETNSRKANSLGIMPLNLAKPSSLRVQSIGSVRLADHRSPLLFCAIQSETP
ncbi:hypothetical protein GQ457_06G037880 [Hibiscus cannabinus]